MLVRQRIAAVPAALARGATKSFPSASSSSSSSSRSFVTTKSTRPSPSQLLSKQRSTFARRAYATEAPAPAAPKKKRFRFLRWTYRLTVLGLLGGAGYLGYSIYLLRHPEEQVEPDPSKKTLVILGLSLFLVCNSIDYNPDEMMQAAAGVPSVYSKNSTPKTTTSSSSRLATSSYLRLYCPRAQPV